MASKDHSLVLNAEAVAKGKQTDLDDLGIAKNAREEKLAARKKTQMTPEELRKHQEMERLYRQEVLKEQPTLQIQGLGGAKKKQEVAEVVHKRRLGIQGSGYRRGRWSKDRRPFYFSLSLEHRDCLVNGGPTIACE